MKQAQHLKLKGSVDSVEHVLDFICHDVVELGMLLAGECGERQQPKLLDCEFGGRMHHRPQPSIIVF